MRNIQHDLIIVTKQLKYMHETLSKGILCVCLFCFHLLYTVSEQTLQRDPFCVHFFSVLGNFGVVFLWLTA